ncbi:hypothetical protein GCM10010329_78340 [Streptomyces spiroverticillatus]|uniref:Uncharacterized protein n=1 Tax=Streptomyces finlayi TaxID=67296 RepID=A0A919CDX5_9ACTN|nr:hypothetical protein [Streptomyces finlayi]GHA43766.1 hypothetical protein GCM10010329_78340 [Streptomyces spiroverticillatus]GHD13190.1 hypothetical protein GCM10010334_71010 [Streptomyces finlayi]
MTVPLAEQTARSRETTYPYAPAAPRKARVWAQTVLTEARWDGDVQSAADTLAYLVLFVLGDLWAADVRHVKPLTASLTVRDDGFLLLEVSGGDAELDAETAISCVPSLRWSMHEDAGGKTVQALLSGGGAA